MFFDAETSCETLRSTTPIAIITMDHYQIVITELREKRYPVSYQVLPARREIYN